MRVLLVEDDPTLADGIARHLRAERFAVDVARDGVDARHAGDTEPFDAAVLDLGLPKLDGVAVLRAWRAAGRGFPVLILTARDGWSDKVDGFKAGADDYLVKPFRVEELVLRLRAIVRRAAGHASPRITCGPLGFDAQLGTFELDGLPLRLTALEWRVLSCLALKAGHVVERADLFERVYDGDGDAEVESNSVEVIVARLRRKLGHPLIETVRGAATGSWPTRRGEAAALAAGPPARNRRRLHRPDPARDGPRGLRRAALVRAGAGRPAA